VWGLAQTCFLTYPESVRRAGHADGDALFDAMLAGGGVTFSVDDYAETWARMDTEDRRIHLAIPELLEELSSLPGELTRRSAESDAFPFVLSAGERRSTTANTIYRDAGWRRSDADGALHIHPDDAAAVGLTDGSRVRITTRTGSAEASVALTDTMHLGHISLPNGLGLRAEDGAGTAGPGVAPNELTSNADCDWLAGTPWHKHVPARLDVVA